MDRNYRVIVAGAGMAGLYLAESLNRAGIAYTIFEKAHEVGGTWRDNTYPGLFVDVPSRQFEFPFAPNYDWSRRFAPQSEIQAYLCKVADERGLRERIRFGEEIVEARYADSRWHVRTAKGETHVADVFVGATGFLSQPTFPAIEGRERFAGASFHSAAWDHSVPYAGKRWGVIGSGASGVQITEALANTEAHVTQFIRRAQWVHIRDNPPASWQERMMLRLPGMYEHVQNELWYEYQEYDSWRIEPGARREKMEKEFAGYLEQLRDPVLKEKLTPQYHLGCTRIPKSDQNYYLAVQRPNVQVENRRIERIVADGVVLADGTHVPLDVLVYATGFDAHAYLRPIKVIGLGGITLEALWKTHVFSYNGIALPGFPNLFIPYGPFSPVNNISVPLGLGQEIGYMLRLLAIARERNATVMPTRAATDRFVERMRAALKGTVWVGCSNWYSDQSGTPVLWPLPQDEHKRLLERVVVEDFEFLPIKVAAEA